MKSGAGTGGRAQVFLAAVGWIGLGLIGGGVLLAIVDLTRFSTTAEGTTIAEAALWWLASLILAAMVLWVVLRRVRWQADAGPVERHHPGLTVFLVVVGLLSVYTAYAAFPASAFSSMVEYGGSYRPDTAGVSLWAMTLVVTLGTVLTMASAYRPRFRPVRRSAPSFAGGLVLVIDLGLRTDPASADGVHGRQRLPRHPDPSIDLRE
ncbi:hypothetical protein [Nocardiopsis lucentensis]|uniref:hypothetical protein n=1 Tax=Nocardiopsis lucentensis TaxID=53441 RepID=UPI000347043C|nr:hypothetical protein [Nocardiopsis lucentensis]